MRKLLPAPSPKGFGNNEGRENIREKLLLEIGPKDREILSQKLDPLIIFFFYHLKKIEKKYFLQFLWSPPFFPFPSLTRTHIHTHMHKHTHSCTLTILCCLQGKFLQIGNAKEVNFSGQKSIILCFAIAGIPDGKYEQCGHLI